MVAAWAARSEYSCQLYGRTSDGSDEDRDVIDMGTKLALFLMIPMTMQPKRLLRLHLCLVLLVAALLPLCTTYGHISQAIVHCNRDLMLVLVTASAEDRWQQLHS